jgi:hypothetical protein
VIARWPFVFLLLGLWGQAGNAQIEWQETLQGMPLTEPVLLLNRSNAIPIILGSFRSNASIKALVVLPAVADDLYLINRDQPPLNLRATNLHEAITGLTNRTTVRATFRHPLLLLHLDRDRQEPIISIRHLPTADRLRQRRSPDHLVFCDRSWRTLQPLLGRNLELSVLPPAQSAEAAHVYRVNLACSGSSEWELLTAISLASRTGLTIRRGQVVFELSPLMAPDL